MRKKQPERPVFQAALSAEHLAQLKAIAAYRGCSQTGLVRQWIIKAYRNLPEEAK